MEPADTHLELLGDTIVGAEGGQGGAPGIDGVHVGIPRLLGQRVGRRYDEQAGWSIQARCGRGAAREGHPQYRDQDPGLAHDNSSFEV